MNDMVSSRKTGGLDWSVTKRVYQCGSCQEHAVAIAEEAVLLLDRVIVCGQHALAAGESAHQHQKTRLGQVEVGEQPADQAELKARRDEDLSLAGVRLERGAEGLKGTVFESADYRGARGNNAAAFCCGAIDGFGGCSRERIALAMEVNFAYPVDSQGSKRTQAYMQRDARDFNTFRCERSEDRRV